MRGSSEVLMNSQPHPGESILHDAIEPLGLSIAGAARHLGISEQELSCIIDGRASVSPEMSIRLYQAFGGGPATWRRMQLSCDLAAITDGECAAKVKKIGSPLGETGLLGSGAVHPGMILLHECIEPMELTVSETARCLGVAESELNGVVQCRAPVTPELAVRLDLAFGGGAEKWCALQANYDVALASIECAHKIRVRRLWRQDPNTHEPVLVDAPGEPQ